MQSGRFTRGCEVRPADLIGAVCRRSHWAIASSSIRSVSSSASNVSSPSRAKTVTNAQGHANTLSRGGRGSSGDHERDLGTDHVHVSL
jgi:hypothetical protein